MLYGLSQNLCPKFCQDYTKKPAGKNALKNVPRIFYGTVLDFYAGPYGLYRLFSPKKVCPTPSSISVPIKCCMAALKSMLILSENTAVVHLDFCAHLLLYGLQKSVRYDLFFLVACCLKIHATLCLGMHALLQQMLSLFSILTSPNSLLLSQQENE
jgi:hypothetical protein